MNLGGGLGVCFRVYHLQMPEPPEPLEAEDEAVEEAQFSDAEEGPPTPSAARDPSASLEEEKRSFALSGVVAADAWQAGG